MDELYAFFDQYKEAIKKDFINHALEDVVWYAYHRLSGGGMYPSITDTNKNRILIPNQTRLVTIDQKEFIDQSMERYKTILIGGSLSSLVDDLFEKAKNNFFVTTRDFQEGIHEWLKRNIDFSNLGAMMEGIYNYASQKGQEKRFLDNRNTKSSEVPEILEQYKKEFKISKWEKVSAEQSVWGIVQDLLDQFYDPEQIIVANYVQQRGKSITVNPKNLDYWEKADIVSDWVQDKKFVAGLFDEAEKFFNSFIKQYNLNEQEVGQVKDYFLREINDEIAVNIIKKYKKDVYEGIYKDAIKVGKEIAEYFMDSNTLEVENWPIRERLDEIKNLHEGRSDLNEYAHMWGFDELYTVNNVFTILEQSDLDSGWETWIEGIEEGFWNTINEDKIKDLLGTDTSYMYEPVDPAQEAYLGPEQTDENEAKKHRRDIADKWKIQYDRSPGKKLNWATEEDFPKKRWESSIKKSNNEEHTSENAKWWGQAAATHNASFNDYVFSNKPSSDYTNDSMYSLVDLMSEWDSIVESYNEETQDFIYSAFWDSEERWIFEEDFNDDFWEGFWEEVDVQHNYLKQQISDDFAKALEDELNSYLSYILKDNSFSLKTKVGLLHDLSQHDEEEYAEIAMKYFLDYYHHYVYESLQTLDQSEWPIAKIAIDKYHQGFKSIAENIKMPSIEEGFLYVKNRITIDLYNVSNGGISSKNKIKFLMGDKEATEWLEDWLFSSILSSQEMVTLTEIANLTGLGENWQKSLDKIEQMTKEWIAEYVNSPEAKEEVYKTVDMPTVEGEVWEEPIDPAREDLLTPQEYDINEERKRRKEIRDKWNIQPGKLDWATEEDFPKKRWESSSKFKKFANLSPELIELAKQMAQDIVPHPLDYMRAQEESYRKNLIPEYRQIYSARNENFSEAVDTANESINDAMWHNLHYEINENPYLDEDLKQEIEENIDEFRDEVWEQTEPILDKLWNETVNEYIQDISSTYDDIIFEAFNRLLSDIEEYWDREEVGRRVEWFMSGQINALEFIDGLSVYAEEELNWLYRLYPLFNQVEKNALKSAETYITEKIPELFLYINNDEISETVNQMYEPVDPAQEQYLGPIETDENEARKHRKQIKDKWKIEPNQPLNWATEEDFPKKPWDFKSKVAAPNSFLPRLYHTMIENLKRTANFDWDWEGSVWNKVQVAYEILNDWDGYVKEIQEESGYKGPEYNLDPLMRDAFIDIFKPAFESLMYVDDEEIHSQFESLHAHIRNYMYPSTPYVIDNHLYNVYFEEGLELDRQNHPKWTPAEIVDFYEEESKQEPLDEKAINKLRKNKNLDKWKPEGWWKGGSKWKKVSADEVEEEEEDDYVPEWHEIEHKIYEGFRNINGEEIAQSLIENYSWPSEVWAFILPTDVFKNEEKFLEIVEEIKNTNTDRYAEQWFNEHSDEIHEYLSERIRENFDYDIFSQAEYDSYSEHIEEEVWKEAWEFSYEIQGQVQELIENEFDSALDDPAEELFEKYKEYLSEKNRTIHPDQEMMDVFDIKEELPIIWEKPDAWTVEQMRAQSKVKKSGFEDWSTPETSILIDEILYDSRILKSPIRTMDKIVRKGGSAQDLANWLIDNILMPYNEMVMRNWEEISDEQDVEAQKQELRRTWKQQARKQFPFSMQKQKQYVQEMEQMQFGLLGDPEPENIERYLLKVENINWQEIYDWVKEDLQYRGKMASSDNQENMYQKIKESDLIQEVFHKLYADGLSWGNNNVKNIIRRETGREPYEYFEYSPSGRDNWPKPDRFYDENQLSLFREMLSDEWGLKEKALRVSKIKLDGIIEPLSKLMKTNKIDWKSIIEQGARYYIEGYRAGVTGIYKNQLELARAKRDKPESWHQSKWKISSHGQNQMAIGNEVAETTFEGVEVDPEPEPEEKIINGKKWKMVRPKPNKQPAEYARPKGGWGFYSKHKKSDLDDWTDSTKLAIEKIISDLPNKLKIRAAVDADSTVRDWIQRSLREGLSNFNPYYDFNTNMWRHEDGQQMLLSPYEERMINFHNTETNRLIDKDQINLGLEQVRNMADVAVRRYDRFDQNLYWELGQLILDTFPGITVEERKNVEKDIYNIINERELESIYNDTYYEAWEKAFNEEVSDLIITKNSKKDAWEVVLDGELGHDIITTGTWEEVKKQTIKWLKQLKDGYINKKNPHDNKKIDAEAKEQDGHAIEDLKLYDEKKRWTFHFDHGKHPYDLIIQPVGYKESKWKKISTLEEEHEEYKKIYLDYKVEEIKKGMPNYLYEVGKNEGWRQLTQAKAQVGGWTTNDFVENENNDRSYNPDQLTFYHEYINENDKNEKFLNAIKTYIVDKLEETRLWLWDETDSEEFYKILEEIKNQFNMNKLYKKYDEGFNLAFTQGPQDFYNARDFYNYNPKDFYSKVNGSKTELTKDNSRRLAQVSNNES